VFCGRNEAFKTSGPTEKQVADEKEGFIRDHQINNTNNGYLLSQIATKYELGRGRNQCPF
jgi:hypothetical protein